MGNIETYFFDRDNNNNRATFGITRYICYNIFTITPCDDIRNSKGGGGGYFQSNLLKIKEECNKINGISWGFGGAKEPLSPAGRDGSIEGQGK